MGEKSQQEGVEGNHWKSQFGLYTKLILLLSPQPPFFPLCWTSYLFSPFIIPYDEEANNQKAVNTVEEAGSGHFFVVIIHQNPFLLPARYSHSTMITVLGENSESLGKSHTFP